MASPDGNENCADAPEPSVLPALEEPTKEVTTPAGETFRI